MQEQPNPMNSFALFKSMDSKELEQILALSKQKDFIAGDTLFNRGDEAQSLFLICSGAVQVKQTGESGEEQALAHLSKGSLVGELTLTNRATRTATVTALENTNVLEIPFAELDQLFTKNPMMGLKFYKSLAESLSRRIQNTTHDLVALKDLKLRHI